MVGPLDQKWVGMLVELKAALKVDTWVDLMVDMKVE
jgi:hypothetical protein